MKNFFNEWLELWRDEPILGVLVHLLGAMALFVVFIVCYSIYDVASGTYMARIERCNEGGGVYTRYGCQYLKPGVCMPLNERLGDPP